MDGVEVEVDAADNGWTRLDMWTKEVHEYTPVDEGQRLDACGRGRGTGGRLGQRNGRCGRERSWTSTRTSRVPCGRLWTGISTSCLWTLMDMFGHPLCSEVVDDGRMGRCGHDRTLRMNWT